VTPLLLLINTGRHRRIGGGEGKTKRRKGTGE